MADVPVFDPSLPSTDIAPPRAPAPTRMAPTPTAVPQFDPSLPSTDVPAPTRPAAPAAPPPARAATPPPIAAQPRAAAPTTQADPGAEAAKQFFERMRSNRSGFQAQALQSGTYGVSEQANAILMAGLTGVTNSIDELRGLKPKFGAWDAYHGALAAQEEEAAQFQKEHPVQSLVASGVGTMMAPGASKAVDFIKGGAGLASRMMRSSAVATAMALPQSFLEGDHSLGERVSNALWGIPLSAVTGAAFEGAPAAGRTLLRGGKNVAEQVGATIRGTLQHLTGMSPEEMLRNMTPQQIKQWEDKAVDFIKLQMQRQGFDPARLTEHPAFKMGQQITGAEAWGRYGKNLLTWLGKRAGTTPESLESTLRLRSQAMPGEVKQEISQLTGLDPEAVEANQMQHVENLRAQAQPLYTKAFQNPPPDLSANPRLREILTRPDVLSGLGEAQRAAANRGQRVRAQRLQALLDYVKENEESFVSNKWKRPPGFSDPTVEEWDQVKKGLDAVIDKNHRDDFGRIKKVGASRPTLDALKDLRNELYRIVPDYGEAAARGGEPIMQEEAFNRAPDILFDKNKSELEHREYLYGNEATGKKGLSPAERQAHIGGWVSDIFQKLRNGKLRMADLQSDAFRGKLALELGQEKAATFVKSIEQMSDRLAFAKRAMPGSQSITSEMAEAGKDFAETNTALLKRAAERFASRDIISATLGTAWDTLGTGANLAATSGELQMRNALGKLLLLDPAALQARLAQPATAAAKGPGMAARLLQSLDQYAPPVSAAMRSAVRTAKQTGQSADQAIQKVVKRFPQAKRLLDAIGQNADPTRLRELSNQLFQQDASLIDRATGRIRPGPGRRPVTPPGPDPKTELMFRTLGLGTAGRAAASTAQSDQQAPQ